MDLSRIISLWTTWRISRRREALFWVSCAADCSWLQEGEETDRGGAEGEETDREGRGSEGAETGGEGAEGEETDREGRGAEGAEGAEGARDGITGGASLSRYPSLNMCKLLTPTTTVNRTTNEIRDSSRILYNKVPKYITFP